MAYALRAKYEQENNFGVTDLLEIYEDGFSGSVITLEGRAPLAFDFQHRETTSEQREYLSIFENPVIMGVLDLYARIDTEEKETLVTDIADSPVKQFQVIWKQDGDPVWYGFPHGRIVEFKERPNYNVKIQFRDFEFLKGKEFELDDTRRKLEASFRAFISNLNVLIGSSFPLRTATSWQCNGTTVTDDFLNQVYHDTYALRNYASDGYSTDQTITTFEALERTCDPMLIFYQWKGFNVYQISALTAPSSVQVATYGVAGQLTLNDVDLRQTIYTKESDGTPSAKIITQNTSYPAIKKAIYEFQHRSGSSQFDFGTNPVITYIEEVNFNGENLYSTSLDFTGNGDEKINFRGIFKTFDENEKATFAIRAESYALDSDFTFKRPIDHSGHGISGSVDTSNNRINIAANDYKVDDTVMVQSVKGFPITAGGTLSTDLDTNKTYYIVDKDNGAGWIKISDEIGGTPLTFSDAGSDSVLVRVIYLFEDTEVYLTGYRSIVDFTSDDMPSISDDSIEIVLKLYSSSIDKWYNMQVFVENPTQAGESIEYRLTQSDDYTERFRLKDSYFGDGPFLYSKSSYRTSITLGDITNGWRRREDTTYISYSRLKLNEVMDFQRTRQLKKTFQLWGEFDPIKVSVYQSENFMYVGGTYNGRWTPICVKIDKQDG